MAKIKKCTELGKPHCWRERDEKYSTHSSQSGASHSLDNRSL